MAAAIPAVLSLALGDPEALWAKVRKDWLVSTLASGTSCEMWLEQVSDRRRQLEAHSQACLRSPSTRLVLIAHADPVTFLASFWAALLAKWNIALANPNWGSQEWQSVGKLIRPDVIWGENAKSFTFLGGRQTDLAAPAILIPTGGSSGKIKYAHHTYASLMTSVSGFRQYFTPNSKPINTYCLLPVYHVSGLMQALRAWASNGQIAIAPFRHLEAPSPPLSLKPQISVISLVPTQLERLIRAGKGPWLSRFQTVFLGGAPPWPALLDRAMALKVPLCLSYGMTETAAMVTALRPEEFLQGRRSSGRSLPHATVQILKGGQSLPPKAIGQIVIRSAAIAQPADQNGLFYTDDLGYLDSDGHLHITGRASNKIISGGENVFPAEVEAALRSTGQVTDVCVLGWPHPQWGEAVVAAYVPMTGTISSDTLKQALSGETTQTLSRYKHPKYWIPFTALPRNAQGKLNRQVLIDHIARRSSLLARWLKGDAFSAH